MQRNCTHYEKPTNINTACLSKLRLAAKYSHKELLRFCNFLKCTTRPKRGMALMPALSTKTTVNPYVLVILTTKITAYPALKNQAQIKRICCLIRQRALPISLLFSIFLLLHRAIKMPSLLSTYNRLKLGAGFPKERRKRHLLQELNKLRQESIKIYKLVAFGKARNGDSRWYVET